MKSILEPNFLSLDQTPANQIARAVQWIIKDFDGRRTSTVKGSGGKAYEFFPTAITDNIPPLHPDLSRAVCLLSRFHLEHVEQATLGVGEEDRGAMIISDLLLYHNLPRTLARWTPTEIPGEVRVSLANEYIQEGSVSIYLNGIQPNDRIILVDDLISTGGTLIALIKAIRRAGAEILEILTIGEKTENQGRQRVLEETGLTVKTMLASTLESRPDGTHSKVVHVHLGTMGESLATEVGTFFPEGFCLRGFGGDA